MKLNLKRGAALVLSASMTLQAPVPAFAKVSGHSANPAAYSTSASSEAQLTAPEGTGSQSSAAAATSAPAATSTGTGAETSAPASTETEAQTSAGQPEIGGQEPRRNPERSAIAKPEPCLRCNQSGREVPVQHRTVHRYLHGDREVGELRLQSAGQRGFCGQSGAR